MVTASASHAGTPPGNGATRSRRAAAATYSVGVGYERASLPDSSSYRTQPTAQMSLLNAAGSPSHCSGAMYGSVPIRVPVALSLVPVTALAIPKSMTLTRPVPQINMFAGLMSRWTTPGVRPWA